MMTKQALMHSVIFLFHIALIFSIMYIFYLILDKLSFSVLFSVAPQIFHSQPTSPSQWEMLTGCDVSVTRPEVERLRFANTHIYTLIIAPSHPLLSPLTIPLSQWVYNELSIKKHLTINHKPPKH